MLKKVKIIFFFFLVWFFLFFVSFFLSVLKFRTKNDADEFEG